MQIIGHTGVGNSFNTDNSGYNWNLNSLSGKSKYMSQTPFFAFSSTVDLNEMLL